MGVKANSIANHQAWCYTELTQIHFGGPIDCTAGGEYAG
jgi:hypothetical protein